MGTVFGKRVAPAWLRVRGTQGPHCRGDVAAGAALRARRQGARRPLGARHPADHGWLPVATDLAEILKQLNIRNVQFKYDDGNIGWAERSPFDGIIVTACPRHIPEDLLTQLPVGGRLVFPVGDHHQQLKLITRTEAGLETEILADVRFVPLLSGKS